MVNNDCIDVFSRKKNYFFSGMVYGFIASLSVAFFMTLIGIQIAIVLGVKLFLVKKWGGATFISDYKEAKQGIGVFYCTLLFITGFIIYFILMMLPEVSIVDIM